MRLELSTILSAVLVASLAACSSSTGDGAGGSGGGTGGGGTGGDTTTGTGGETTVGTGGAGGGVECADDCECVLSLEETPDTCDADCDSALEAETATFCTISCDEANPCPTVEDGTFECLTDGTASLCGYTCAGGDACPGGFVCDEANSVCIPDQPDV